MYNLTIKKLHKSYGKRKIQVYQGKKLYGEITEFWHWICLDLKMKERSGEEFDKKHEILRKIAMENLWWLLHSDNIGEDYTELEAWEEKIERWDKGHSYGADNKSLFFLQVKSYMGRLVVCRLFGSNACPVNRVVHQRLEGMIRGDIGNEHPEGKVVLGTVMIDKLAKELETVAGK